MWNKNETVANKRCVSLFVFQSNGQTPAPAATKFQAVAATCSLASADTNVLTGVILQYVTAGSAGNAFTIQFVADGAGSGSVTNVGNAYKFHFASGVTTINNAVSALSATFNFTGSYTGSSTLNSSGDVFGPLPFTGGQDSYVFVRPSGGAWATALGTLTNTGIDGDFEYQATQAETNVDASEIKVRIGPFLTGPLQGAFNEVVNTVEMHDGTFNQVGEGSIMYGDILRVMYSVLAGQVSDFRTSTLAFLDVATATKTRLTVTEAANGRTASTVGNTTP